MKSEKYLEQYSNPSGFRQALRARLGLPDSLPNRLYLWGFGQLGRFAVDQFQRVGCSIAGIAANDRCSGESDIKTYQGIPFIEPEKIDRGEIIVICSLSYPVIEQQLVRDGLTKYYYYEVFPFLYPQVKTYYMAFESLWDQRLWAKERITEWKDLFQADPISEQILDDILMYRLTFDDNYLDHAYLMSIERGSMYFDREIIYLGQDETFVDCGGYTGDTTEEFIFRCHNRYNRILFFEPDPEIFQIAATNMHYYKNITWYQSGVGEKKERLLFDVNGKKGGGKICEAGNVEVEITDLDRVIRDLAPTYIKMDIEGSEMKALKGGRETIERWRPRLAVSVYHRPDDLFEIVHFISSLNLGYQFYLRHYTRTYADTVLYCVPQ